MAIFYYRDFEEVQGCANFGDSINPYLLGKLFKPKLLDHEKVCLVGIGTIIEDRNIDRLKGYEKKIIFSSGTGYGRLASTLDSSWVVGCVRGPKTAEALGLPSALGVCDGAILLSEFYDPVLVSRRKGTVFIPHLKTHWLAGDALRRATDGLGWRYLPPDAPQDLFINHVRYAERVVTEAMHGAILADAMRVPWLPVSFHEHNTFKWMDWFYSIDKEYKCHHVQPTVWSPHKDRRIRMLKSPYQIIKVAGVRRNLHKIIQNAAFTLSDEAVINNKKQMLLNVVDDINQI